MYEWSHWLQGSEAKDMSQSFSARKGYGYGWDMLVWRETMLCFGAVFLQSVATKANPPVKYNDSSELNTLGLPVFQFAVCLAMYGTYPGAGYAGHGANYGGWGTQNLAKNWRLPNTNEWTLFSRSNVQRHSRWSREKMKKQWSALW